MSKSRKNRQRARKLARSQSLRNLSARSLRYELLEDRRLLAVVTVDTIDDVVDFNDGITSLREAIFATNLVAGADEIQFDFGFDGPATILLTRGELKITDSVEIVGLGAELLTIDAQERSRVFNINDGDDSQLIDVEVHGLTLTNGIFGAIFNKENLSIIESTITGNSSSFSGGGVYSVLPAESVGGKLLIQSSTISGNFAKGFGGGVFVRHNGTGNIQD